MSTFTPGPWEAVPQNGAGPIIAHRYDTGNQMQPTGLRLIAHMLERRNSIEQDRANANLIAAAPEMYAALIQACGALKLVIIDERGENGGEPYGTTAVAYDAICAALSKAEASADRIRRGMPEGN